MTLRGLIFDVDGTLADTEEAHRRAFNAAFAECGLTWNWSARLYRELLKVAGGKERIAFFIGQLRIGAPARESLLSQVGDIHAAKTRRFNDSLEGGRIELRTGIERIVREAHEADLKLAIASTTTRRNVDTLLRTTLGPGARHWFTSIACGDRVERKKPAPDIYRLALAEMGLRADECIAFEDSAIGLAAARGAGLLTIVAPTRWTTGDDLSSAALVVPEFDDAGGIASIERHHRSWSTRSTEAA